MGAGEGWRRRAPRLVLRALALIACVALGTDALVAASRMPTGAYPDLAEGAAPPPVSAISQGVDEPAGSVDPATGVTALRPADTSRSRMAGSPGPRLERGSATPASSSAAPLDPSLAAPVISRVSTSAPVVALTFDDGWSPTNGRKILDILRAEHVSATFFVNSVYVRWDPRLWIDIVAAGFVVGNHTYLHRDVSTMAEAKVVGELRKNADVFRELTGSSLAPLFRPPYGRHTVVSDVAAAEAGAGAVILWSADAGDTAAHASDKQMIRAATRGGPGSIVLMHVGPDATPRILRAVIASYRDRGFTFVTVPQLLALR